MAETWAMFLVSGGYVPDQFRVWSAPDHFWEIEDLLVLIDQATVNSPPMKRLGRGIAALSLVLCLATVALWIRSYYVSDNIWHSSHALHIHFTSSKGHLELSFPNVVAAQQMPPPVFLARNQIEPRDIVYQTSWPCDVNWHFASFFFQRFQITVDSDYLGPRSVIRCCDIAVPAWFVTGAFLLFPGLGMARRLRTAAKKPGCCANCGYDLRATPERCPECGVIPAK